MMLMQFPLRWTCRPDPEERPSVWPNSTKPWHGTDDPLFSRKAPMRKLVRFSLTSAPIPLPKKRQHLFLLSEHDRTKMPTCHKCRASSLSRYAGRGLEQRQGQPVSDGAPCPLSVTLQDTWGLDGLH